MATIKDMDLALEAYKARMAELSEITFKEIVLPVIKKRAKVLKIRGMQGEMGMVTADNCGCGQGTEKQEEFMDWFMILEDEHYLMNGLI